LVPLNYACVTGAIFGPEEARRHGFLDRLVAADDVLNAVWEEALALTRLDTRSRAQTKARVHGAMLELMREGIERDFGNASDAGWPAENGSRVERDLARGGDGSGLADGVARKDGA
jgi:enoyl-CoA hydratase/carnithine racemase